MTTHRDAPSYRQAVEEVLQLLNGQWVSAVLTALALGALKFSEIGPEVNAVEQELGPHTHRHALSDRVLARTLDRMEENQLVVRHADETVAPRTVRYELTPRGRALLAVLRHLAEWVDEFGAPGGDSTRHP